MARVAAGRDRGLDDVVGGREVGLAGAEADDGAAGGLERLGLRVDGEGRGLGDRADPAGDAGCARGHGCPSVALLVPSRSGPNRLRHWVTLGPVAAVLVRPAPAVRRTYTSTCRKRNSEGSSSTGRVSVSKTGGCGFKSLLPCREHDGTIRRRPTDRAPRRRRGGDEMTQTRDTAARARPPQSGGGRGGQEAGAIRARIGLLLPPGGQPSCARSSGRPATSWSPTRWSSIVFVAVMMAFVGVLDYAVHQGSCSRSSARLDPPATAQASSHSTE